MPTKAQLQDDLIEARERMEVLQERIEEYEAQIQNADRKLARAAIGHGDLIILTPPVQWRCPRCNALFMILNFVLPPGAYEDVRCYKCNEYDRLEGKPDATMVNSTGIVARGREQEESADA